MPRSSCDFCCNPVELARNKDTWRGQVAGILCQVLAAIEAAGAGSCDCVTDGQAVNAATTGGLVLGTDGANYQVLSVNSSGELNIAELPAAVALTDNFANPTTTQVAGMGMLWDGAAWDRQPGNATDGTLVDLGLNNDIAVTSVIPGTGATNLGKAEDAPHSSGDTGVGAWGVSTSGSTVFGAVGDYTPIGVSTKGTVLVAPSYDVNLATTIRATKLEDEAAGNGDAGVAILNHVQATPTATTTDGNYGVRKLNNVGAGYTEPANQVGTYGGTTTAGAAGAVPTTGVSIHTNAAKAKIVTVRNKLDVDVQISLDAGTTYIAYVGVGDNLILDLGTSGRWTASNIFAKAIGSNSASGNIYVGTVI